MKNIKWYNLNKQGYIVNKNIIINPLSKEAGIYIYKLTCDNKKGIYIGSTINMTQRFRQHKYRANIHLKEFKYNNILYNSVAKYGWENFKFGIIKYVNFSDDMKWLDKKEILFRIEQNYINKFCPNLNINKIAGSMLGFKHKMLKLERIKKLPETYNDNIYLKPSINQETILKLKLHNKNITVSIFSNTNQLIQEFIRIRAAAEFVGLSPSSVSGYIKSGRLWNNRYYFKLKTNTILDKKSTIFPLENKNLIIRYQDPTLKNNKSYSLEVLENNQLLFKFRSIREASKYLNISKITLTKYSFENKLWKNKFKFKIST